MPTQLRWKADAAAAPARFRVRDVALEWLLVSLIAAGAGAILAALNFTESASPSSASALSTPDTAKTPASTTSNSNLIDLPPIVTNLSAPMDTWVRLEASIVFDTKTMPHPEIVAAEIATDELAYLRTIGIAQIQGPIGLENIRQDLADRAVTRSGGKVSEFILRTLVVQ